MNIEDCFKKELLIRKRPAQEKARQSLKAAKVYMMKAKDNIALKNCRGVFSFRNPYLLIVDREDKG